MSVIQKQTLYISRSGVLFLKFSGYPDCNGVFRLNIEKQIDPLWFDNQIINGELKVIEEFNEDEDFCSILGEEPEYAREVIPIASYNKDISYFNEDNYFISNSEESVMTESTLSKKVKIEPEDEEQSYDAHDYDYEDDYEDDYDVPPGYMDDCPEDVDPDTWREYYTGG